jgi:hypothetical protein
VVLFDSTQQQQVRDFPFAVGTGLADEQHAPWQQHDDSPKNELRQNGFLEPSGQTHSKWGDDANRVVGSVSHTVASKNILFRTRLIQA